MKNYITVKELIEELKNAPQDAPVFVYSYNEEADVQINKGFSVVPREAYISEEGYIGMSPYGCQGDSEAYWFLESNEDVKEVVVFGNGWTYNKNIPEEDYE